MAFGTKSWTVALAFVAGVSLSAATVPHFSVVRSAPTTDQVLTASPERLQYWFSQAPAEGVSEIKLFLGTAEVAVGKATIVTAEKTLFVVPVKPLGAGTYKMSWRAAGDDGHAMKGETSFTIAAPKH